MKYDRIILELLDRVSLLEEEVAKLKGDISTEIENEDTYTESDNSSGGRDTTKYILDGKKYGKNRLVLAVVKKYMKMYPKTSAEKLVDTFDKSLQGSLGVVRTLKDVKQNYTDYKTRFFVLPDELIETTTEKCVVCTQWSIHNIGNIVTRAEELGIKITVVK